MGPSTPSNATVSTESKPPILALTGKSPDPSPYPLKGSRRDDGGDEAAGLSGGAACRELARVISRFGEMYERIEISKRKQMMELEKQRVEFDKELELQRLNMFMDDQVELGKKMKLPKYSHAPENSRLGRAGAPSAWASAEIGLAQKTLISKALHHSLLIRSQAFHSRHQQLTPQLKWTRARPKCSGHQRLPASPWSSSPAPGPSQPSKSLQRKYHSRVRGSDSPSMATESRSPSSKAATFILVLVLLATLYSSCHGDQSQIRPGRKLSGSQRRNNGDNQSQIRNCNDMSSELQCSRNPMYRWCRSDVFNDMCFPKLEALQLPLQDLILLWVETCGRTLQTSHPPLCSFQLEQRFISCIALFCIWESNKGIEFHRSSSLTASSMMPTNGDEPDVSRVQSLVKDGPQASQQRGQFGFEYHKVQKQQETNKKGPSFFFGTSRPTPSPFWRPRFRPPSALSAEI
ncbi:hypothetical protein COP2_011927 [Malus domestica]